MHQLDSVKISLPLKKKFAISKGETKVKINYLTIMNNRYSGEASGSIYYGPSAEELEKDIKKGLKKLKSFENIDKNCLIEISDFDINPIAKSALMGMVLNFLSGESKRYPWEILDLGTPVGVKSSITISIDKSQNMIKAIEKSKYPIIKIKMGHEDDILILDALGNIKNKEIRVDANGAWSCAKAEEMIFNLSKKGVKIIEQPTTEEYVSEWKHLKGKTKNVKLIMDEGLNSEKDLKNYSKYIDGVNIKMEKCGGIIEALKIAEVAENMNKKVMLGCMVESSVGIAQSLYMSSKADYFDLDGPLLLKDDIAMGINYNRESIEVDREIIGGPKLKRDVVEKYITE